MFSLFSASLSSHAFVGKGEYLEERPSSSKVTPKEALEAA